ncbi:uncharacterized protein LOC116416077 [Nasonia vitripennis]|uniref:Uncharacterized protein n=1 Tax=Nasonia vitripennis TaxID=7425 RepID=A0A7M7Q017_NASVI|nr:uncharacterized protein LOC116416077 [Nasonia vitripennis]
MNKIENPNNSSEETSIVHDELIQYVDGRYLSPMEAAWRLQGYPLCGKIPAVERLGIHTKDQQHIVYEENKELQALNNKETTLTAWFKLNKIDDFAKTLKYVELTEYYRFNKKSKSWIKRSRSSQYNTIARLNIVSPKDTERFFFKLILNRARGPTSFEDLKNHKDIEYQTYKDAALAIGLIEDDLHIFIIFEEACHIMLPFQLRKFFAWFILAENIQGNTIWNKFKNYFTEDFKTNKENNALSHIQIILENEEKSCKDFSLPEPNSIINDDATSIDNVLQSADIFKCMFDQLTDDQKAIFEELVDNEHKIYFIDGPGEIGEGKVDTFKIPQKWKTTDVCNEIYKNINLGASVSSVILAPHDEDIKILNNKVLKLLHGESKTYYSVDYATHKGVD